MMLIDPLRCKGCGRCVSACPAGLISLETTAGKKCAVISCSGVCTACGICSAECLYAALAAHPNTDIHVN